ncbi:hypothetical protein FISHEDRAFT_60146 [Fistulina hepatica ATCC 64428]|uniref:Uncharacterized protein n=1 Tax=Fistulina hepatica ATCC 64428 TaxID=1128425 RepID=A0A0D7A7L5_9AGAR|nr:hypothetical protein FISHEDRAFT_60146 [Fistulina hepatica ATCC 64428]
MTAPTHAPLTRTNPPSLVALDAPGGPQCPLKRTFLRMNAGTDRQPVGSGESRFALVTGVYKDHQRSVDACIVVTLSVFEWTATDAAADNPVWMVNQGIDVERDLIAGSLRVDGRALNFSIASSLLHTNIGRVIESSVEHMVVNTERFEARRFTFDIRWSFNSPQDSVFDPSSLQPEAVWIRNSHLIMLHDVFPPQLMQIWPRAEVLSASATYHGLTAFTPLPRRRIRKFRIAKAPPTVAGSSTEGSRHSRPPHDILLGRVKAFTRLYTELFEDKAARDGVDWLHNVIGVGSACGIICA